MNDALNKTQAASGDRLARLVRHGIVVCVLACTASGAMAQGQDRGPRRDDMQQQQMRERFENRAQEPRFDQRSYEMREEQRRQAQAQHEQAMREEGRRGGRMTPDERRDLRRQINEAGMDLYPNARRR
jgi:hypothetical protein